MPWTSRKWPRRLDANPAIKAVFVQANETSTGVQHPVQELAAGDQEAARAPF